MHPIVARQRFQKTGIKPYLYALLFAPVLALTGAAAVGDESCGRTGVAVQVLGSGGPESTDRRASSGYLLWQDGKPRVLIDLGPGSAWRLEQTGARLEDLDAILLTHLHVDHSGDLPALVKAAFFTERDRDLPVYGPTGNKLMPATTAFVRSLFAKPNGAFRYLAGYVNGDEAWRLRPHDVPATGNTVQRVLRTPAFTVSAIPVPHGALPAVAWRIDIAGVAAVFSGDTSGDGPALPTLAGNADVFVAHHAIPEGAGGAARKLHMPPSVIGKIAADAGVKQLVLSHRMTRALGREQESTAEIRRHYAGPLTFADDGQCFAVGRP